MNVLEKILEEIEDNAKLGNMHWESIRIEKVEEIIRSHMNEAENGGWIPVSERPPEEGEKCIITDKCGYVHDGIIYDYADSRDEKPSFHRWDDEYWQCFRPDVIAWQPLPEPYRPEEG
ncbi:DUF551 domain-containing protein [Blautia sp.]|uniref:DUF551 domain-containing protein n=1 Tax=Blautia sp. TaxID=1955243 RepID=UPI003AB7391E